MKARASRPPASAGSRARTPRPCACLTTARPAAAASSAAAPPEALRTARREKRGSCRRPWRRRACRPACALRAWTWSIQRDVVAPDDLARDLGLALHDRLQLGRRRGVYLEADALEAALHLGLVHDGAHLRVQP